MKRSKTNNSGFTLIELMIVVGIIGILVSIVVPGYQRYVAKSRQVEARLGLSSIYALEKSFYSEYSAYIMDFDAIGYTPEGSKRYYAVGWATCSAANNVTGYTATPGTCFYPRANVPASWINSTSDTFPSTYFGPGGNGADRQTFFLWSGGQIQKDAVGSFIDGDWWTIDQNKSLVNGCTSQNCGSAAGVAAGCVLATCCAAGSSCIGY